MTTEYSMAGKLLELLKQVAPKVTRLAVLRNSATPTGPAQFGIIQAMAPSLRVEVSPINVRDAAEIEQGINAFAHSSNDGLIVTAGGPAARHRDLIVALAADARSPTVCAHRLGLAGSWALRSPIRHQVPPSASGAAAPYRTGQASEAPAA
jgi:putative ABC transport system substrate-binding protein